MMVIAVGLSSYNLALFHLVNHAFYKGLLFLGAGAVIHSWADNQDFRKYGALRAFLPLSYTVMLIASLSLVAFPFMTGFYSKDFILESLYGYYSFSSIVVYFIATIGAIFTTLYSVKVLYLTFLTNPNGPIINYSKVHEGDIFMSIPLIILALFSIFFGYLTKDIFIGIGSGFFSDNSLFIHPLHEIMLDTEFAVPSLFKLLPLLLTISLTVVSLVLSEYLPLTLIYSKYSRLGYHIFSFFNQRFLIELLYNKYITGIIFKLGAQTTKILDKGSVERIGPFGLEKILLNLSRNIAKLDTGVITSYALYILIGFLFYIVISFFSGLNSNLLLLIILALYVNLAEFNTPSKTVIRSCLLLRASSTWVTVVVTLLFCGMLCSTGVEPGSGSNIEPIKLLDVYIQGNIYPIFTQVPYGYIAQCMDGKRELLKSVASNPSILNFIKSPAIFAELSHPSENSTIKHIDNVLLSFFSGAFSYTSLIITSTLCYPTTLVVNSASGFFTSTMNSISDAYIHFWNTDPEFKHLVKISQLNLYTYGAKVFAASLSYAFTHWLGLCPDGNYFVSEVMGGLKVYVFSANATGIALTLTLFDQCYGFGLNGIDNPINVGYLDLFVDNFVDMQQPEMIYTLVIDVWGLTIINTLLYYYLFT